MSPNCQSLCQLSSVTYCQPDANKVIPHLGTTYSHPPIPVFAAKCELPFGREFDKQKISRTAWIFLSHPHSDTPVRPVTWIFERHFSKPWETRFQSSLLRSPDSSRQVEVRHSCSFIRPFAHSPASRFRTQAPQHQQHLCIGTNAGW